MKSFVSVLKRCRSLVIIAFAVVMVVAAGLSVGNGSDSPVLQQASAASPGWYVYFGKVNASAYNNAKNIEPSDYANNYGKFEVTTNNDPYFFPGKTKNSLSGGGTKGSIDASTNKILVMRYWSDVAGGSVQLFFGASGIEGVSGRYTTRQALESDGKWHDLYIDMSSYSGWTGTINAMRVDLDGFAAGKVLWISFIAAFDTVGNARLWASGSINMGTVTTSTTTTTYGKKELWRGTYVKENGWETTSHQIFTGTPNNRPWWNVILCVKETNGEYRIGSADYGGQNGTANFASWFTQHPGAIALAWAPNQYTSTATGHVSDKNYIEYANGTVIIYTYGDIETTSTTTKAVSAPVSVDYNDLDTSGMTGSITMSGGSTSTSDYTSAPSTRRFYRSNLSQYLTYNGTTTTMSFSYSSVATPYVVSLPDATKGVAVAKIAIYYSDSSAYQNNKDGSIQWTRVKTTSGEVDFLNATTATVGSYYDQDVDHAGYGTSDAAVESGCDKYIYHGAFCKTVNGGAHVLPAGTYKAKLEYDVLFDKYAVIYPKFNEAARFDGVNMRKWAGASWLRADSNPNQEIPDDDALLVSIPLGTPIYVGYDSYDISTGTSLIAGEGSFKLNGGVYHSAGTSGVKYEKTHIWRLATCIINGVYYEGWIDTHLTTYHDSGLTLKSTSSASLDELVMIPRKYERTDSENPYNYGTWEPYGYTKASTSNFDVRWSWTFNSQADVKAFATNYNDVEHSYYGHSQVEYNTNNFVTLTSTAANGSTSHMWLGHFFSTSRNYSKYSSINTQSTDSVPHAATGVAKIVYKDPLNAKNAGANAHLALVYRSQDSNASANTMRVYLRDYMYGSSGGGYTSADVSLTCDGTWRTAVIKLSSISDWTVTSDPNGNDGLRLNEMVEMYFSFFNSGDTVEISGGKSIDLAAVAILSTKAEAESYGDKYISTQLGTQKGSVKAIATSNGTISLAVDGSGTLSSGTLTGVTAGSTFKVTVTPASGYYCSKLCWRPTGYILNGMTGKTNTGGTTYFEPNSSSITSSVLTGAATEYVNVLDSNFINNGLFTGGNTASGWQNSSWGNNTIMTIQQINAYNDQLVTSQASSTKNDQPVVINDMSAKEAITTAKIQTYVNTACSESDASSWGLSSAYTNRNYSKINSSNIKLGVVTKRASIRALPTSSSYINSDNHNAVCESGIAYATPVWVLHTSTDEKFVFVQAPYYRGWVDAASVATTTDYGYWIGFAYPAFRGDFIVTTDRSISMNNTVAEMGCAFELVSTSGSTYTIKIPTRASDGKLSHTTTTVTTSNSNRGYLPYTWNNYVAQAFKYLGTAYSWGDEDEGRVDCSSLAQYVLKTFGFKIMRNTSQQESTGYTAIMNSKSYSYSTHDYYELAQFSGTPMILVGGGHAVLYLGYVNGNHYIIHSPSVGKNVVVETIDATNLEKWGNYAIFAPNNYLEEAPLRKLVNATGATFIATIETPAYGTYNSTKKFTLNDSLHAEESVILERGTPYADKYVLNSGGRDIYVWAVFEKIQTEIAIEIQLEIPDGYSVSGPQSYAGITYSSGHSNVTKVYTGNSGSTRNVRLTVFKGFKLVKVITSGGVTRSGGISEKASNNNGVVIDYTDTFNGTTISQSGPIYASYTGVDTNTYGTTDGGITYVIQPTSYTIQYNSNYPSGTQTTITGTHYYNCTGNLVNSTASFTAADGPGSGWSATKTLSYSNYNFLGWSEASAGLVKFAKGTTYDYSSTVNTLLTTGKQDEPYNLYGVWVPVNYSLSVEYVSQVDRELIGTPDGFCVKVGSSTLGKGDVVTSETPLTIDLSKFGTSAKKNVNATYANNILSITTTTASDPYCSVDIATPTNYNIMTYKYMTITYKMSKGSQANLIYFMTNGHTGYAHEAAATNARCTSPGFIGDNQWHTITINMSEMYAFYHVNQYLKGMRIPGSNVADGVLDISAIKLYKNAPTIWGESTVSNSSSNAATALTKQGNYGFIYNANKSASVNVISAQQADYDFVMDISKAYMIFSKHNNTTNQATSNIYTSSEYSSSGYNSKFGTPVTVSVNGVSMLGYDVSSCYINNHTFDMAAAGFTMPECDVKLVFVCDYVNYSVKVFTYTAGTSYGTIPTTSLSNNATTASTAFSEATISIASSKNNGIVGRYGSTITLSVSGVASGKKFLGWYEKTKDASTATSSAYGKLLSTATTFTLSTNLHKDMEIVAVFGSNTSTNTTFNFMNVSGQVIQTLIAAKGTYIPVTNITAVPYKSGSVFTHWEFLKNADRTKATQTTYNSKTYYLLDGTTQPTYVYSYSVLYNDANCTQPAYIYVNGSDGTVNIDGAYTKLSTGTVKISISGSNAKINGDTSATVAYNTTVTAKATGSSAFKGWIDMTNPSTRYTPESYKSGDYYYPFISYSKTFSFKAIKAMTISAVYASASEADKKPNISITPVIQKVSVTGAATPHYKYTAYGFLTIDPGSTYQIIEWGTLFFMAPNANTVPTTTSYDKTTGGAVTTNILTTDTPTTYLQHQANSSDGQISLAGQYAASVSVASARTIYVRMYCRYSFTNSTTGETEYVVTYSDTYKFTSAAYTSGTTNEYITPTLYATVDLKPDDYNDLW